MSSDEIQDASDALLLASRALVAVAARSLGDVDQVTLLQFRALVVLTRPGPVTVKQLAEELALHASTATRLCDRLVAKRLMRRTPRTSGDRREVALELTAPGRRLVERVMARRRADLVAIAARMSPAERRHAVLGLEAFAAAAGEVVSLDAFGWAVEEASDAPAVEPRPSR